MGHIYTLILINNTRLMLREMLNMTKYTQKQLRSMVSAGIAIDISRGTDKTRTEIMAKEEYLDQVGYAAGLYGCSGKLLKGHKTGQLYAIIGHVSAIYVF